MNYCSLGKIKWHNHDITALVIYQCFVIMNYCSLGKTKWHNHDMLSIEHIRIDCYEFFQTIHPRKNPLIILCDVAELLAFVIQMIVMIFP